MSGEHAFVVPVFGEPVWLDRCLDSLRRQTRQSNILITTSTPSARVADAARRHGVPLEVNPVPDGIAADWNFAVSRARGTWVTLAHQDDWYAPGYVDACLRVAALAPDTVLVFSAADEALTEAGDQLRTVGVKRLLCDCVFLGQSSIRSGLRKRLLLSFGDPIPCPSVMLNRDALPDFAFSSGWRTALDWIAWLEIARRPGAFGYVRQPLVRRHVHAAGATVAWLRARAAEDDRVLRTLWPVPIAAVIGRFYAHGRRQYDQLVDEQPR